MLEGITVLNQEMIMDSPDWVFSFMIICLIVGVLSFLVCMNAHDDAISIISSVLCLLSIVCLMFVQPVVPEVKTGRYRYEVTIDESVSFNDIYEWYEIVEQRGDIWVLEEKEE